MTLNRKPGSRKHSCMNDATTQPRNTPNNPPDAELSRRKARITQDDSLGSEPEPIEEFLDIRILGARR
eukprot:10410857-Alexandrium_andersonii.AAC.1